MIKQFSAGDITVRPFQTYKNWNIQSITSGSFDAYGYPTYFSNLVELNEGIKYQASFSVGEPTSSYGRYKRVVYNTTDAMFYRYNNNPPDLFGLEIPGCDPFTGKKEIREIHDRIMTMRIAQSYWGEKIRPNSVQITDNSNLSSTYKIYDDGLTNLYISGSYFNEDQCVNAVKRVPPPISWDTSSGVFTYTRPDGIVETLSVDVAKAYMGMGLDVVYTETSSSWHSNPSGAIDIFEPESEHFGESVSVWDRYIAVGSPMDSYSLSGSFRGYAALYKFDSTENRHRLIRQFHSPFSYEGVVDEYGPDQENIDYVISGGYTSSVNIDGYGTSVSVDSGFLAIGAPVDAISGSGTSGCVYVYDKNKGGIENWGIINVLTGSVVGDNFGHSVSIDDGLLAVGAPDALGGTGGVYIYRRYQYMHEGACDNIPTSSLTLPYPVPTYISGNYTYNLETILTSSIARVGDKFGWCLETNNDRVLVGTYMTGSNGYAALFTCSYYSGSAGACPTASWTEYLVFEGDASLGDLPNTPEYSTQIPMPYDGFGMSVALNGNNIGIGSYFDKGFAPYSGAPVELQKILGAVYFYNYRYIPECSSSTFWYSQKTFGNRTFENISNFGRAVSIDNLKAAVSYESDTILRNVWYDSGSGVYTIESQSYQSSGSDDGVLGRVGIYSYDFNNNRWIEETTIRKNKEENSPFNVYGKSIAIDSGHLAVGAPIYNFADPVSQSLIIDPYVQSSSAFPYNYSGSVYVYDFDEYNRNPHLGNIFYRNGYVVLTNTSSNFQNVLTMTGSRGFDMKYQGSHTIFEHEYMVSIQPGEFNYSTNPSSLIQDPLLFDVDQNGVFDLYDVNYIMLYLNQKRFQDESRYTDNAIVLDQSTLQDYSWWGDDLLQTEAEDALLLEQEYEMVIASGSALFTQTIYNYIENNLVRTGILDIDGNGTIDLKDGAILVSYFTNTLTPPALQSYIDKNSTRRYVNDVVDYLDRYCGKKLFNVDPNFLNYQSSSSYDRTGSYLAPYFTTIGLYEATSGSLVAIAKLGKPIKNLIDWPINIIVRFDT